MPAVRVAPPIRFQFSMGPRRIFFFFRYIKAVDAIPGPPAAAVCTYNSSNSASVVPRILSYLVSYQNPGAWYIRYTVVSYVYTTGSIERSARSVRARQGARAGVSIVPGIVYWCNGTWKTARSCSRACVSARAG